MNKIYKNTDEQDTHFDTTWTRKDKVFATTLAITTIAVLSFLLKYDLSENAGSMVYAYLAASIAVGSFTAITAMEIDKKICEDRDLRIEILNTGITMGFSVLATAVMFIAAIATTLKYPSLLFPAILIETFFVVFVFVPKLNGVNTFLIRKAMGCNASYQN